MNQEEEKAEALFERLAGRVSQKDTRTSAGAEQLRGALRAQVETMREAETNDSLQWSEEQSKSMEALKQRLMAEGVLGVPLASGETVKPGLLARLRHMLFGTGWERPVAVAASVLFAVLIVLKVAMPPTPDFTVVRGGDSTPILESHQPLKVANELTAQLDKLGAEVLLIPINEQEWTIRIDVAEPEKIMKIKKLLAEEGIVLQGNPPYRLTIRKK